MSVGDTSSCTFKSTVDWGDKSSTTKTYPGAADGATIVTFTHTYKNTEKHTYPITTASETTAGGCGIYSGTIYFTLAGPSCQQVTQADGSYVFGGCVTKEDGGKVDVTSQQSNVDGIDVSASSSDKATYDDGASVGHELVTSGAATLSLALGGTLTSIFKGKVVAGLDGKLHFALPKKTVIAGLPVSGTLTVAPAEKNGKASGAATATVGTTLPPALGGGKASWRRPRW